MEVQSTYYYLINGKMVPTVQPKFSWFVDADILEKDGTIYDQKRIEYLKSHIINF